MPFEIRNKLREKSPPNHGVCVCRRNVGFGATFGVGYERMKPKKGGGETGCPVRRRRRREAAKAAGDEKGREGESGETVSSPLPPKESHFPRHEMNSLGEDKSMDFSNGFFSPISIFVWGEKLLLALSLQIS